MKTKTKLIRMLYEYFNDNQEYQLANKKSDKLINELSVEITRLQKLVETKENELFHLEKKLKELEYKLYQKNGTIPIKTIEPLEQINIKI